MIGSVTELCHESLQGDIFQLGNTSWRVLRVGGKVRVEVRTVSPSIPLWLGEAPAKPKSCQHRLRLRGKWRRE
jgi:ATP-dependent Lhr-like helicase